MKLDIEYPGLKRTLLGVKDQAVESVDYMDQKIPDNIRTPEALFYYLKGITKFKKDPFGIEHIKTSRTLFEKYKGRGDCDCFTVTSLASLEALGLAKQLYIVLVSKNKRIPSHIYVAFDDKKGVHHIFDLTNPWYDFERTKNYRYKQLIPINI